MADTDPPTVLVVEDDERLRTLYRETLEPDYEVLVAATGEAGLDLLDDEVDVVLLDRRLPGQSGGEVLAAARERGYDGPVVMVTAVEPELDIIDLPFDGYVVKPVSGEELLDVIEAMLDRAAYDDAVREFFALGSKVAALETKHARGELEADPQYRDLLERLAEAREASRSALASLPPDEIPRLFKAMDPAAYRAPPDDGFDAED